jgi:hypothetical protein
MTSFFMKNISTHYCGAGGIAEAVGLILEWSDVTPTLLLGIETI